jgi:HK97 family phage major capsid protein
MNIQELLKDQKTTLAGAEAILAKAENEGRALTAAEQTAYDGAMARYKHASQQIQECQAQNTLSKALAGNFAALLTGGSGVEAGPVKVGTQKPLSHEYTESFLAFIRSGGKQASSALSEGFDPLFGGFALPTLPRMSGAMYEGSGGSSTTSGGYAVSVPTDNLIVPLGVPDIGVRSVAKVLSTQTDLKIPTQSAFSTAALKSESGASTNTFTESNPTLGQFTLSAWMLGLTHTVSWELMQDVQMLQEFAITDLIRAVDIAEDAYFVSGTGSSQPLGLIGNVGTGTASAYAVESTGSYLLQSTLDVLGTLKAQYFAGASWLMSRSTGAAIRKAQLQSNLFAPVWTRENGRDYLHGFPVVFSQNMPSLPTATSSGVYPILFGSFADGYVIGDRGGSGTFIKILDQPMATAGQTILLGYKRTDGRVRIAEAIQAVKVSHS